MSGELEQKDQDLWTGKECAHAATAWRCAGNEDGATWPKTSNSRSRSRNARWMKKHADRRRPTRPEACTRKCSTGRGSTRSTDQSRGAKTTKTKMSYRPRGPACQRVRSDLSRGKRPQQRLEKRSRKTNPETDGMADSGGAVVCLTKHI